MFASHQHGFRGAFYVLSGSSIHTQYDFSTKVRVNENLQFGDVTTKSIEYLQKGQYRRIEGGAEFIHSLFHLDYPSVSVVVRTYRDPVNSIQFRYHKPFLAINPFYKDHKAKRQVQILKMLKRSGNPNYRTTLMNFASNANLESLITTVTELIEHGAISRDEEEEMLTLCGARYPEVEEYVKPVLSELRRVLSIQRGRLSVTDPTHRFFMALLMNASDKNQVNQIIRSKYPEEQAVELILKWVKELNEQHKFDNMFSDFHLEVLASMIKGLDFDEIIGDLERSYDPLEIQNSKKKIFEIHESLKKIDMFKVLLHGESMALV